MSETVSYAELQKPYIAQMLTTSDNPFNPFDEFDDWNRFDTLNGYNTCALIARLVDEKYDSREFDVIEHNEEINEIIDRIVEIDPLNQYIIVAKEITPNFNTEINSH